MLVEKSRDEALRAFIRGRKVLALTEFSDGELMAEDLAVWLTEENTRYPVNVPAVENEEFAALGRNCDPVTAGLEIAPKADADPEANADPAADAATGSGSPPLPVDVSPAEAAFPDSGKSKLEVVRELREQGLNVKEIGEKTGYKLATIYKYYKMCKEEEKKDVDPDPVEVVPEKPENDPDSAEAVPEKPVDNKDCHLCKSCKYRGEGGKNGCDYAYITGDLRGSKVEECRKYVKGSRRRAPKSPIDLS